MVSRLLFVRRRRRVLRVPRRGRVCDAAVSAHLLRHVSGGRRVPGRVRSDAGRPADHVDRPAARRLRRRLAAVGRRRTRDLPVPGRRQLVLPGGRMRVRARSSAAQRHLAMYR